MSINISTSDKALLIETLELVRELATGRLTLTSMLYHDYAIMDKQQLHQILRDNTDDLLRTLKTAKEAQPMTHRYTYAQTRTLQQAKAKLEDMLADGEISEGEKPDIEPIGGGYAITILEQE